MALVVFLQEDEDVPSVYRNLKIFLWNGPQQHCDNMVMDYHLS